MKGASTSKLAEAIWNFFEYNRAIVLTKATVKAGPDQVEAVHELRVATKKIRTVYRLCSTLSEGDFRQKKEIADLRTLFRAAGTLRELQVNQGVLEVYEDLHVAYYRKLSQLLLQQRRSASPRYQSARKEFKPDSFLSTAHKIAKILEDTPPQELLVGVVAMAHDRLQAAIGGMPPGYEPEGIHQTRIYLKEAMYLIALLHSAGHREAFSEELLAGARLAAEIAGDWHDREVFHEWLQIELRPQAIIFQPQTGYSLLLQDLSVHTRQLVKRFRDALEAMESVVPSSIQARQ